MVPEDLGTIFYDFIRIFAVILQIWIVVWKHASCLSVEDALSLQNTPSHYGNDKLNYSFRKR